MKKPSESTVISCQSTEQLRDASCNIQRYASVSNLMRDEDDEALEGIVAEALEEETIGEVSSILSSSSESGLSEIGVGLEVILYVL